VLHVVDVQDRQGVAIGDVDDLAGQLVELDAGFVVGPCRCREERWRSKRDDDDQTTVDGGRGMEKRHAGDYHKTIWRAK